MDQSTLQFEKVTPRVTNPTRKIAAKVNLVASSSDDSSSDDSSGDDQRFDDDEEGSADGEEGLVGKEGSGDDEEVVGAVANKRVCREKAVEPGLESSADIKKADIKKGVSGKKRSAAQVVLEGQFEVESVLRERGKTTHREYLIKWKGYPESENTWEPEQHIPRRSLIKFRGHQVPFHWPWIDNWELVEKLNEDEGAKSQKAVIGNIGGHPDCKDGDTWHTSAIQEGVIREDADGHFVVTESGTYYMLADPMVK